MVTNQPREQAAEVELVGLGSPFPAVDLDARSVDHDALDTELDELAMDPEPVPPRLAAAENRNVVLKSEAALARRNCLEEGRGVASVDGAISWLRLAVTERQLPGPPNGSNGSSLQMSTVPEPTTTALALAALCLAMRRVRLERLESTGDLLEGKADLGLRIGECRSRVESLPRGRCI